MGGKTMGPGKDSATVIQSFQL